MPSMFDHYPPEPDIPQPHDLWDEISALQKMQFHLFVQASFDAKGEPVQSRLLQTCASIIDLSVSIRRLLQLQAHMIATDRDRGWYAVMEVERRKN
jgi:hypothetical protein